MSTPANPLDILAQGLRNQGLGKPQVPNFKVSTPQPLYMAPGATPGLVQPGTIDLKQLPAIDNGDGSWSTVNSTSFTDEKLGSPTYGKEVLVKGILNGKRVNPRDPKIMRAIRDEYYRTGKHLGVFDNGDNADLYANRLHNEWEANKIPGVAINPLGTPQTKPTSQK